MSDDYTQDRTTTGSVAVGGVATGEIGSSGDRDWFAVDLVAGRTYVIDLRGRPTGDGTLSDPYLRGIQDADGDLVSGTTNDDGGEGLNSRLTFTASESGTYYIAAGAFGSRQGTYEVEVTDTAADDARDGATDLGDITDLAGPRFRGASLDGDGDRIDYFRFTLTEAKEVGLGLRRQDADADLFLEDAEGNVLYSSTVGGTANEAINETLVAGTYYIRVEAQEEGGNDFRLRYGVGAPDSDEVARLEQQQQGGANQAPAFAEASYAFDLAENADGSTSRVALGTLSATDPEDATLTYSIEGGNSAGLFEIDASTGALSYKGSGEDFESDTTSHELTVRASDGSLHSDVTVTVNINDVGEAPAFAEASYAFDLAENADGSTNRVALGTVAATDPEAATLTYSIEGGNAAGLFEIDGSTGALSYKGSGEDFESDTTGYELTVRASDGNLYSDVTVAVNITDVEELVTPPPTVDERDSATDLGDITDLDGPRFPNASLDGDGDRIDYFQFTLTEAKKVGLGLRQQDADADLFLEDDEGNVLHSSTVGGTANEWISQTLLAGTYYVRVEAQEEGNNQFKLRYGVSAPDADEVARLEQQQQGGTNAAPTFGQQSYAFDLAENADGSTTRVALGTVAATDPEAAALTYSIEGGNEAGLFEIDASSGALSYKGTGEDYESDTTGYELTVRASDGSLHSDVTVAVNVTDAAEAPAFGQQSYAFDLVENADGSTNRVALGTVAATDPEAATVTYSIEGGNTADLFEIDASTGALSYKGTGEDYESDTTGYELTVRASDGSLHGDVTVAVNVTDAAEAPAFGQQSYAFDLAENADGSTNRVALGTVAATDPEAAALTYSIEGGNSADLFEIDGSTGALSYKGSGEDFESDTTGYELTVRASDGSLHSDVTATVNITDVEEQTEPEPLISQQQQAAVQETVSEPDGEDFSADTSSQGRVAVGGAVTGEIGTSGDVDWYAVDLRAGTTYRIDLEGFWSGGGMLWDPHLLGVYGEGGTLLPGTANDNGGSVLDSRVEFTAAHTGTYYVAAGANGVYTGTYRVSVTEVGTGDVPIPEAPTFAEASYAFDLWEHREGYTNRVGLGTVTATDPDSTSLTYSIEGGNSAGLFEIDGSTGALWYRGPGEDYESGTTSHELTVRASDGGLHSDVIVTVNVIDLLFLPEFAESSYTFDLAENADGSTNRVALGTIAATDREATSLTYGIESGNSAGLFEIDGSTGVLSYRGSGEDYESGVTSYELEVRAGNDLVGGTYVTVTINVTNVAEPTDPEPLISPEQQGGDFSSDTTTTGRVTVGGTATGEIGSSGDIDWFSIALEAGKTYQIDTIGAAPTNGATLPRGGLHGVYDGEGNKIPGVYDPLTFWTNVDDQRVRIDDDQVFFTPEEDGTYYIAASNGGTTATGTYTVRVTEIEDDFPETVDTTGSVQVGGSATGEIEYQGDEDWFAVELVASRSYTIDLKGEPKNDGALGNPYIRGIFDADGNRIPDTSDSNSGSGLNSQLHFTATESGTYYIAARGHAGSLGTYKVEVWEDDFADSRETTGTVEVGGSTTGEIQRADDRDSFAVELEAGKTYQIDVGGANTGGGTMSWPHLDAVYDADGRNTGVSDAIKFTLPRVYYEYDEHGDWVAVYAAVDEQAFFTPDEDGTYYLVVSNLYSTTDTGTYTVQVTEIEDDLPATVDTTGAVEVGGTAIGEIQYETDRDWFAVELTAGETYKVELLGGHPNWDEQNLHDPCIRGIHDADGRLISDTTDESSSGPYSNSEVLFTPEEDGTYYVAAGNSMSGHRDEDVGTYTLQVSVDDFTDDADTTGTVEVGGSVTGEIEAQGDRDWFAVTLEAGKSYQIDMEGSATDGGTLPNPTLRNMRDASGVEVRSDRGGYRYTGDRDSGEGLNARVTFTPAEDGTYYVVAASGGHLYADDSYGRSLGTYTVSVEELVDAI